MKRFMVVLTGVIMAAALAACTPTKQSSEKRNNPPAGATQESSVDGAGCAAVDRQDGRTGSD